MILLTPGPLTTRRATRDAMLADWGSRDPAFIALTAQLRQGLLEIAQGGASHAAVPIQGSGTYVVEAALATLLKPQDRLLVLVNGAYGERMAAIARRLGHDVKVLAFDDRTPVDGAAVAAALAADKGITHVGLIHCETTTGLLNPLEAVAAIVADAGRLLIVDAMSSFGALPIDLRNLPAAAVLASSNKCLEGTPGIGFALIAQNVLAQCQGNSASTSLDLYAQWRGFETNGQWRFTPPVQVVAAAVAALQALAEEGGPTARLARYRDNLAVLLAGMKQRGFALYLDESVQAPIIATFRMPPDWNLSFAQFYEALAARGYLIYPGKLTDADTFRIGVIGAVERRDFEGLLDAITAATAR